MSAVRHPVVTVGLAGTAAVLLIPSGAGIGIRHLLATGLTGVSVLGLVLLASGVLAAACAGRIIWHRSHRWHRLWLLPVVVVASLVMWPIAQGTMFALAPRTALASATPAQLGLPYSTVTVPATDGVLLSAWFVPSTNGAAVITVPGSGSTRTATLTQAAAIAGRGYGVLLIDPRGQGHSAGRAMDAGWYGERDIGGAVAFLQRQQGVDPHRIGVLGLSMGGEQAIGAAGSDPAIRAVVAEGATHRTAADKAGYLPGGVGGAVQRGMDRLTYGVAALLSPAPRPGTLHAAIAGARSTEFLLIAAGRMVDEPRAVAYLRSAAPDRVQTWTVPGARHTRGLSTAPDEWTARVTRFFDRTLRGTIPGAG